MSTTYKIAEVSRRTGFTPSTLRYYENVGLVPPADRTEAGYRLYDDGSLARLAFISRAKQLGCTLEEITDLVAAWEGKRCEPVQARLRDLVGAKVAQAQDRTAELVALTAQLQEASAALGRHTPDGPCDDHCGCSSRPAEVAEAPTSVALVAQPAASPEPPIACTLGAGDVEPRVADWHVALAPVVAREAIEGGVRLVFPPGAPLARVAELAAAEQACCMFFRFALTVDTRGAALEVTAPAEAADVVASLFGTPS